jgi:hypothetical protein
MRRSLITLTTAIAIAVTFAATARAQSVATKPGFELIVPSGAVLPTGSQGDSIKRGNMTAVQLSYGVRPALVVTGTFGWSRTRPLGLGSDARLHIFGYDLGAEIRAPRRSTDRRLNFKPFAGIGAGARTYNYRHVDSATTHDVAAYASAGAEIGMGRVRLRLEARDYVTGKGLDQSAGGRKNDVALLAGVRLALR